jgi:DNA-binding CsgD family transcriptional regulator
MLNILCITEDNIKAQALSTSFKNQHVFMKVRNIPSTNLLRAKNGVDIVIADWSILAEHLTRIENHSLTDLAQTIILTEGSDQISSEDYPFLNHLKNYLIVDNSGNTNEFTNLIRLLILSHERNGSSFTNNSPSLDINPEDNSYFENRYSQNSIQTRKNISAEILIESEIVLLKKLRRSLEIRYQEATTKVELEWCRTWLGKINGYIKKLQDHVITQEFNILENDFLRQLKNKYPSLSNNDLKICALIRMHFSVKQIAEYMLITPESVRAARYRMRKKLRLNKRVPLDRFLITETFDGSK